MKKVLILMRLNASYPLERNQVRGAYTQHAEYLKDRARMMQWWADYLDQLETGSNVVPGKFGAG